MQVLQKRGAIDDDLSFAPPIGPQSVLRPGTGGRVRPAEPSVGLYRVLVVEDDPSLLAFYDSILIEENLPAEQSANGHDALEKLSTTAYDLVITDLNLPGLDGISLLQWIQRHRPATTAVVISGDGSAERILAAMRGGAKDYLVKPFTLPEFQGMLNRWCRPQRPFNREVFSSLMKQLMHDVRGEIAQLEIMTKTLQRGKAGMMDAGGNAELRAIQEKVAQLKGLTADYSILTRNLLQGGDIPTERIGLKGDVIAPLLGEMEEELQRKKIRVSCSQDLADEGDAYVLGNRLMLKSVFRTLFGNAIRHCNAAGVLSYGISTNGRRYKVYVANEGEVVPAHLQETVFDESVPARSKARASGQEEGLGLGLALAKDILLQHGGDIWYESFVNGSKFVCTLPPCPGQRLG